MGARFFRAGKFMAPLSLAAIAACATPAFAEAGEINARRHRLDDRCDGAGADGDCPLPYRWAAIVSLICHAVVLGSHD
jgi:hypothetical protein